MDELRAPGVARPDDWLYQKARVLVDLVAAERLSAPRALVSLAEPSLSGAAWGGRGKPPTRCALARSARG